MIWRGLTGVGSLSCMNLWLVPYTSLMRGRRVCSRSTEVDMDVLHVIFANHLTYLRRVFLKFIIFQILFWHMMGITSHSLMCTVRQQVKPTVPHWQNVLGEPKPFPLLPVFSMYAMYRLWSNVKDAACGAFCILQESCPLLHDRSWWPYWMTTHLHVGQFSVMWNSQVGKPKCAYVTYSATTHWRNYSMNYDLYSLLFRRQYCVSARMLSPMWELQT